MQIVRYRDGDNVRTGVVERGNVREAQGDMFGTLQVGPEIGTLDDMMLAAPVQPGKIVAIGLNYQDHIEQDTAGLDIPDSPVIFLKPPSAVVGPDESIVLASGSERIDAEAELAIVIGKRCRNVAAKQAAEVIFGYCCSNDVSARDYQRKDGQWVRAKGFDTFAPLGPAIVTNINVDDLKVESRVNGETFQSSSTKHLIFNVPYLIEFVSGVMTLEPGDVIITGTPAGPPQLHPGDTCEVEIEGLGILRNPVEAAS